ncbi:MAG: DUF167 domain-containing protein [Tepidiformaceae bacterium]
MTRLTVRVTPRAARDRIDGFDGDGVLRLRVTAPPAEGEANVAVVKLLARALGLPARDVVLVSGATARRKVFEVALSETAVASRLRRAEEAKQ